MLSFETGIRVPTSREDPKRYQRNYRARNGRANEYSRDSRMRKERYLERPFIAWDGEGYNDENGIHQFAIFASSNGDTIADPNGIATELFFDTLIENECDKDAIHIIYGGGYDFNMALRDMDKPSLEKLYKLGFVTWNGYKIRWRPSKSFSVSRNDKRRVVYDVLPFFQTSFVKACDSYLGLDWFERDRIIEEKKRRGSFTWEEIKTSVAQYNNAELVNLVELATELRLRLDRAGIRINRWDGPGAIATALFQEHRTKDYMALSPEPVQEATQYAYAGGRFEILKQCDTRELPDLCYEYDLNSAYPAAIRYLPCLAHGEWIHVENPKEIEDFGVYHISYYNAYGYETPKGNTSIFPLWHRNPDGTIVYAPNTTNWFWTPEARLVENDPNASILEGWVWQQSCDHQPFGWVEGLYNKRAALKKAGDGAHIGYKLGLNSLYGKLAQQIGAKMMRDGEWRIPPYHQLEWAGYITSSCRANVYQAALESSNDIIAFETDALFSRVPLPHLTISSRLGDWEETIFESITYVKSGIYYATTSDGEEIERSRGFNRGTIPREKAAAMLGKGNAVIQAPHTQFITLGAALHTMGFDNWRCWQTKDKNVSISWVNGKRWPVPGEFEMGEPGYIPMFTGKVEGNHSSKYAIAWKGDGRMYNLDESVMNFKKMGYEDDEFE